MTAVDSSTVVPGQPVILTSDLYGGGVTYHGTVEGFSGGSGAAFAAIPAQNATGNWIKVVQRVPMRIKLDPAELEAKRQEEKRARMEARKQEEARRQEEKKKKAEKNVTTAADGTKSKKAKKEYN